MISKLKLTTYTASAIEHNKVVQDLVKESHKELIIRELVLQSISIIK